MIDLDILADIEFIEKLRNRKYDGAFVELLDICSLVVFTKVGIKNIMLTSPIAMSELVHQYGLPTLPSFVPS